MHAINTLYLVTQQQCTTFLAIHHLSGLLYVQHGSWSLVSLLLLLLLLPSGGVRVREREREEALQYYYYVGTTLMSGPGAAY